MPNDEGGYDLLRIHVLPSGATETIIDNRNDLSAGLFSRVIGSVIGQIWGCAILVGCEITEQDRIDYMQLVGLAAAEKMDSILAGESKIEGLRPGGEEG